MAEIEVHYLEDYAAVYIDGKLETWGRTFLIEDDIFKRFGIKRVQYDDNDFSLLLGEDQPAKTLEEIEQYKQHKLDSKANELLINANELLKKAAELEV